MGLFDFITKNPATNTSATTQPVTQNASQAYSANPTTDTDRLVQTPFSDVKYPLPQNQQPADLTQFSQSPAIQNSAAETPASEIQMPAAVEQQSVQSSQLPSAAPQLAYTDNQTAGLPPLGEPTSAGAVPDLTQDAGSTSFLQYNSQFDNQTPAVSNLAAPVSELPTSELATPISETTVTAPTAIPAQESTLPELTQPTQTLPDLPQLTNTDDTSLPELPNNMSLQNNAVTESSDPTSQIQAGLSAPLAEPAPEPAPAVSGNSVEDQLKDTLVIGTENNTNKEESYPEENTAEPSTGAQSAEPAEVPATSESTETPVVELPTDTTVESEMPVDHIQENVNEDELDKEIFNNVSSEVQNEFDKDETESDQPAAEMPKVEVVEAQSKEVDSNPVEEEKSEAYKFKVFMNIGLVGLNVKKPNQQVTESLVEVVRSLASSKLNFVLDSGKGYGETLLNKLVDYKDISIKGVYLKPFYSDYSDEPKVKLNVENYSTAVFSNQDLKVRHLIKSSDVFIMPETEGISNVSLLFSLLSNAYLYFGQHKPVILLGSNWTQMVSAWKASMGFGEMEANLFNVCQTSKEVVELLIKWDKEYTGKSKVAVHKVLDMRNESDESDYFVNNV